VVTSFPELDSSPSFPVWRALLALAVVFMMLATTGWTAVRQHRQAPDPRAAALAAWEDSAVGGRDLPDPESSSPRAVARFFASLTAAQRHALADDHPLVVGNLAGVPVELRYYANRRGLTQAREVEEQRMKDTRLTAAGRQEAGQRMHRLESLLSGNRQILAFDPTGSGRAAEVFGDLGRASRVSVVVPGVDTSLLTFERTERRYTATVGMAQALYDAEREAGPGSEARTAVIAWADYTSPAGIDIDAMTGRLAEDGAARLITLAGSLPGTSEIALFCHSYGSVVCGLAASKLPDRVTDITVSGSPGMRADAASQLGTGARVWAVRDADDWIQDVPNLELGDLGHGVDPVSPGFGARVLSAKGAAGHTGYFEPGTDSLVSFAEIGVGSYHEVRCSAAYRGCDEEIYDAEAV
jgi:pimeloyl-ACP methyl ester carboxylesterase